MEDSAKQASVKCIVTRQHRLLYPLYNSIYNPDIVHQKHSELSLLKYIRKQMFLFITYILSIIALC